MGAMPYGAWHNREPGPLVDRDRSWVLDASCQDADPEIFFAPKGHNEMTREALAWCGICPVRGQCLAEALANPPWEDWGVRGGTTSRRRASLRRQTMVLYSAHNLLTAPGKDSDPGAHLC
jgi:WhiB family transcriptional regulator, redox-sensing transcriptional regulator